MRTKESLTSNSETRRKVLWSNGKVQDSDDTFSKLPFPFAAIDVEEMDLTVLKYTPSKTQGNLRGEGQENAVSQERYEAKKGVDSLLKHDKPHDGEIPASNAGDDLPQSEEQEEKPQTRIRAEEKAERTATSDLGNRSQSNLKRGILSFSSKESVSPLSSWYLVGGRPDFRPAASKSKTRKRLDYFDYHETSIKEYAKRLKRMKENNVKLYEDVESILKDVKKDSDTFSNELKKKLT